MNEIVIDASLGTNPCMSYIIFEAHVFKWHNYKKIFAKDGYGSHLP